MSCAASDSGINSLALFGEQGRLSSEGQGWARAQESVFAWQWPLRGKSPSPLRRLGNTGTILRAMSSASLIVWILAYRCEASVWMQSSWGETCCCFLYLLFIVVVSESHSHGSEPPCAGNWLWTGLGWKGTVPEGRAEVWYFLKFYGKIY